MDVSPLTDDSSLSLQQRIENKSKFTCIPIGLTQGQFNLNAFKIPDEFKWFQMRSACLVAMCYIYIQDPLKWTSQTINSVVLHGAKVVKDHYIHFKESAPIDCTINVQNYIAKIRIDEPVIVETIKSNTSLCESLQLFFGNNKHGLFRTVHLCYLIWKTNEIYYLFDALGKGKISPIEDKNGFASLVCTESIKDVSKLLKNLSSLKSDDCYSISTIKMKHFRKGLCEYNEPRIQYSAGTNTYTVINDCFGILCGKIHIGHNGFQSFKNQQAMAVGLMACIYNKVEPSNSWNSHLVDKVVLLGTNLYHECKKTPQGELTMLTIRHLPLEYCVSDWIFKIEYEPYAASGQISYSFEEMVKNYSKCLVRPMSVLKSESVLIQTRSFIFAIWKNNEYYYLFDAYARNEKGEIADEKCGVPCIHMHCSLESLCSVLCKNLDEIAENDEFVLHYVKKISLERKDGTTVTVDDFELLSICMDDLYWAEMSNFQESTARSLEVCNLDDTSDEDIFLGTLNGQNRGVSSITSSQSRSTVSSDSYTESSGSRTESSGRKADDSNSQSNDDSERFNASQKRGRSKSPKSSRNRSRTRRGTKDDEEIAESQEQMGEDPNSEKSSKKQKSKGKKSKKEGEQDDEDEKKSKKKRGEQDDEDENDEKKSKKKRGEQDDEDENDEKKSKKKRGEQDDEDENDEKKSKKKREESPKSKDSSKGEIKKLVVVQSSSGTEASIIKLLNTSFKISDRVLLVTGCGDFFVAQDNNEYILCDGCLCDYNALRQINLAELDASKRVDTIENVVNQIIDLKKSKKLTMGQQSNDEIVTFRSDMNASFWELMEGMIDLKNLTNKFNEIKSEMI